MLVKFKGISRLHYYVGLIESVDGDDVDARFMRKKGNSLGEDLPIFLFSTHDECSFPITDIIKMSLVPFTRGAVVQWLARPLIPPPTGVQIPLGPGVIIRCKNLALYIRDCVSLCLSDETLKAVGPFYLVSRGSKRSHQSALEMCNLSWTPRCSLEKNNSLNHSCVSPNMGCLEYT